MGRTVKIIRKFLTWAWQHRVRSGLFLLLAGTVIFVSISVNKPPQVDRVVVVRGEIASVVEASGKVAAKESVELYFTNPGKIVWVGVKNGDYVHQYQAVASMDQRTVEKNIKSKLLQYLITRQDFDQTQADNDINGKTLESVGLTDSEKRIVLKAQYSLDKTIIDVETATLAKEEAVLVSPIAGTVVEDGKLTPGQWLTAATVGTTPIEVTNLETIYFLANVDEADYQKIKVGQAVAITLDGFPGQKFDGQISSIGKQVIKKTGGSVQIPVDVAFEKVPDGVLVDLNGNVQIILERKEGALTLEKKFVHPDGDKYTVNIMANGKISPKTVEVGTIGVNKYEIISGLNEGETVVSIIK